MPDPILTLGELEPDRPLIAINRKAPDGPWQAFKHRHFDVLLRWFPVRYVPSRELYPLRRPSEFGLATIARIQAMQGEIAELQSRQTDPAAITRAAHLLRECTTLILDAPQRIIAELPAAQHIKLLLAFPLAVTGRLQPTTPPESPSTSDASSPASAASTAPTAG